MDAGHSICHSRWRQLVLGREPVVLWEFTLEYHGKGAERYVSRCSTLYFPSYTGAHKMFSDTSLVDPWSRMISYHFLNQTTRDNFLTNDTAHGAGQLWSNIPKLPTYQSYQAPFPMVVADARPVGSNLTTALGLDATVYEVTAVNSSWISCC